MEKKKVMMDESYANPKQAVKMKLNLKTGK